MDKVQGGVCTAIYSFGSRSQTSGVGAALSMRSDQLAMDPLSGLRKVSR